MTMSLGERINGFKTIEANRSGQRREPAADDVPSISERIGWLPFAGPAWPGISSSCISGPAIFSPRNELSGQRWTATKRRKNAGVVGREVIATRQTVFEGAESITTRAVSPGFSLPIRLKSRRLTTCVCQPPAPWNSRGSTSKSRVPSEGFVMTKTVVGTCPGR